MKKEQLQNKSPILKVHSNIKQHELRSIKKSKLQYMCVVCKEKQMDHAKPAKY